MAYDPYSRTNQYIIDGAIVGIAFFLSYQIRFEGVVPALNAFQMWAALPLVIAGRLATNTLFGIYRRMWRYVSIVDAMEIAKSFVAFSLLLLVLRLTLPPQIVVLRLPLSVIVIELLLSVEGALGLRLLRRVLYHRLFHLKLASEVPKRVLLVGAGSAGVITANEMLTRPDRKIVGFLDDNPKKIGAMLSGIPVLGPLQDLPRFVKEQQADEVVVCIARAPRDVLKRIWRLCDGLAVRALIIPALNEMIDGEVQVSRLRQVSVEELLGREAVNHVVNEPALFGSYHGKRILITGAGGSIGSELARQLAALSPESLLLMDKDENGLYELQHQFATRSPEVRYRQIVADIRSVERVRHIFKQFRPEIVFHAAAHKHVPLMEANPAEAVSNNVFGTKNLVEHAIAYEASLFVLISTDKAVRPSSIMGATKRVAEWVVQSKRNESKTRFACVRFGNVLSSRGSVIPLFQKQLGAGGPITLTDPEVTRYFMTIPEAVQLVIQAGLWEAPNGRVFVLDMGNPVRIVDLARDLIELSGLRPDQDIRIETIGLRPGEKLREELIADGESLAPTEHPSIFAIESTANPNAHQLDEFLKRLAEAVEADDAERIYRLFGESDLHFRRADASRPETATRSGSEPRAGAEPPAK